MAEPELTRMKERALYKKFEKTGLFWLHELDKYNDAPFLDKPSEKEWSLGQLYSHLSNGTLLYHIKKIENCIAKEKGSLKGKKKFKGKMLFLMGSIPAKKIKSPLNEKYPPAQPEDVKQARNSMIKLLKSMNDISEKVLNADKKYRVEHPSFGYLNAQEWYKLIELHFKHHLKQKKRLDKRLIR